LDLSNVDFQAAILTGASLEGCILRTANLSEADLQEATLENADLSGSNLEGANLTAANLDNVRLDNAVLRQANLSHCELENATLVKADLRKAYLRRANLANANLSGANLYGADLSGCQLVGADLTNTDLSRANLNDVTLTESDLRGAFFEGTPIERAAKVSAAIIDTTNYFSDEQVKGLAQGGAFNTDYREIARPGIDWAGVKERLQRVDLSNCQLQGADFSRTDLSLSSFIEAELSGALMVSATLHGTDLTGATLIGTNLSNASFVSAILSNCDLTRANLEDAYFEDTDILSAASLLGTKISTACGLSDATLEECAARHAFIEESISDTSVESDHDSDRVLSRNFTSYGNHGGMARASIKNKLNTTIAALILNEESRLREVEKVLASALDVATFVRKRPNLHMRYLDEYEIIARDVVANLVEQGYVLKRREE
ncbi:MAG: pentapeptide repeat-containing protein, partial [Thermomicrobiales bacterium]